MFVCVPNIIKDNYNLIIKCSEDELDECSKLVAETLYLQDEQEVKSSLLDGFKFSKLCKDIALSKRFKLLKHAIEADLETVSVHVTEDRQ